jgi:hypothetical protein
VFAKLFDTKIGQVLFVLEYQHEEDETVIHQIFEYDETRVDLLSIWREDDQVERAKASFDTIDQAMADRQVAKWIEAIDVMGGLSEIDTRLKQS